MTAPSIFISHGSPMFALEPGVLGPNLRAIGQSLRGITAVLVVSPHWQTRGVRVGGSAAPETIHDFGGFHEPLYQLQYPAPGAPTLAQEAASLLVQAGFEATLDDHRGLDHGAWVPLRYLFPDAGVPVFQVSLPQHIDAQVSGVTDLGKDGQLDLVGLSEGRPVRLTADHGAYTDVQVSPDGKIIATGGWTGWEWDQQGTVYLFDAGSGELLRRLTGFGSIIGDLRFSPDGRWLAIGLHGGAGLVFVDMTDMSIKARDEDYAERVVEVAPFERQG